MFRNCDNLADINISSFNTSKVTDMEYMFENCSTLTSLNLTSFNVSKVTSMSGMFEYCKVLQEILVASDWEIPASCSTSFMFNGCGVSDVTKKT